MRCTALAILIGALAGCGGALGGDLPDDSGAPDGGRDAGRDGGPADAGDAGQSDGGGGPSDGGVVLSSCSAVCFAWDAPVEVQPPQPGVTDFTYSQCNIGGFAPGTCPAGFSCGATRDVRYPGFTLHMPICEPPSAAARLDTDVPAPSSGVPVTLDFRLNDAGWSATSVAHGAGQITLTRVDGGSPLTLDVPTSSAGALSLLLPPGEYAVQAGMAGAIDFAAVPPNVDRGRLIVADAGSADVPYRAVRVPFAVTMDGQPIHSLGATEWVMLSISSKYGRRASLYFTAGQIPSGTMWLEPDLYQVAVQTGSREAAPAVLNGEVVAATAFDPRNVAGTAVFDLPTATAFGTVRMDGKDLPAGNKAGTVILNGKDGGQASITVGPQRPATFSGRVYRGTYDAYFNGDGDIVAIPGGGVLVQSSYSPGAALPIELHTVLVSGTVTLNGAQPPDANGARGTVSLRAQEGGFFFELTSTGPATFSGLVFAGSYDVRLSNLTTDMPYVSWPLQLGWTASTAHATWNVPAHRASVAITASGAQPSNATNFGARGQLSLRTRDKPLGQQYFAYASWELPWQGALATSMLLPDATWELGYSHTDASWMGLPLGGAQLDEIPLGPDVTRSYDLRGTSVSGTLTVGRAQWPLPRAGMNRGKLLFIGVAGSAEVALPASGPATYSATLYPGIYDVSYECAAADGCDQAAMPEPRMLWYGVELR